MTITASTDIRAKAEARTITEPIELADGVVHLVGDKGRRAYFDQTQIPRILVDTGVAAGVIMNTRRTTAVRGIVLDAVSAGTGVGIEIDKDEAPGGTVGALIEECAIRDFLVGVRVGLNATALGSEGTVRDCFIQNCTRGISFCHDQTKSWTIANNHFLNCTVAVDGINDDRGHVSAIRGCSFGNCERMIHVETQFGNLVMRDLFSEGCVRIGDVGNSNSAADYAASFYGCDFRFDGAVRSGADPHLKSFSPVLFSGCSFTNTGSAFFQINSNRDVVFHNCRFHNDVTGGFPAVITGGGSIVYDRSTVRDTNEFNGWRNLHDGFNAIVVSPAQITIDQDNYDPGDDTSVLRLTTNATRNITGIRNRMENAAFLTVINVGANDLVLVHDSASSDADKRMLLQGAVNATLNPDDAVSLVHDGTKWRQVNTA